MQWFLLVTFLNTTNIATMQFISKDQCELFLSENMDMLKELVFYKDSECKEGVAPSNSTNLFWPLAR